VLLETLETHFQRVRNFLGFAKSYFARNNPLLSFLNEVAESLKDFLTVKKKLKMSRYRLNYHQYQLKKMESLIAENDEHTFLKGKNINEVR
jgi:hypothetical protein